MPLAVARRNAPGAEVRRTVGALDRAGGPSVRFGHTYVRGEAVEHRLMEADYARAFG